MISPREFIEPLRRLHDRIRGEVLAACESQESASLSRVAHEGAGDITYEIDRISESALLHWFDREFTRFGPFLVIGEGIPGGRVAIPFDSDERQAKWRIVVDPIDGTRGLMYQKRPAFILTGIAPNRGGTTSLADIEIAVQTEIPLIKQHLCDQLWAVRGEGADGIRFNRITGVTQALTLQPSKATVLRHGFSTICRFFPGGREVLAAIDDAMCDRLVPRESNKAAVFEDQYACTSGQLYSLMMGHDRFIADLRPLVRRVVESRGGISGHCCHPYDLCTSLIAEESGVVVAEPNGGPLKAPLDVESDVAWVGCANPVLYQRVSPVLYELMIEHGLLDS